MSTPPVLPALPGASADPGTGAATPVLFEGLLEDASALAVDPGDPPLAGAELVAAHGTQHRGPAAELVAALQVPVHAAEELSTALADAPVGLRVVLVTREPGDLDGVRRARELVLAGDRVELTAVQVAPADGEPAGAVRALLGALDLSVTARIEVPVRPGWREALDMLAEDGAEELAVRCAGDGAPDDLALAALLRHAVDRDLTVHAAGGLRTLVRPPDDEPGHGVLNLLCAVRAALNGAETPEVAAVLAERRASPLLSALRRMSDADAAVVRAFLASVAVSGVAPVVTDLLGAGLVEADQG